MTDVYDSTARAQTRNSDPERRLYDAIADRQGWAWQLGRALHVATDREVTVDLTGPPTSPFRVVLTSGDTPWWHHDPMVAVRQVEMHGEPRYTLTEALRIERELRCAEEGHRLRVQQAADGSPGSVVCSRCPGWWAVSMEHLDYVLDALVAALRFASPEELPLTPGSPWFDALVHYRAGQADELRAEAEAKAKALAAMADAHGVVNLGVHPRRLRGDAAVPAECYECETTGQNCLAHRTQVDGPTEVIDPQSVAAQRSLTLVRAGDAQPPAAG